MTWVAALIVAIVIVQISTLCTTIYLHRTLAHHGLQLHPGVAFLMRLELWLSTGIVPRQWVAVHRKHHQFPDQEGDPHSPVLKGLWKIQLGNVIYYKREASNPETVARYSHDIPNDLADRLLFNHAWVGPALGIVALSLVFGWLIGPLTYFFAAGVYIFLNATINGVCHMIGYKNFKDAVATNLRWVALITAGEGLHNNHHQYPGSAKFSMRKWEPDPGWAVIRLLTAMGLATPIKVVTGEAAAA